MSQEKTDNLIVVNPYTLSPIGEIPQTNWEEIDAWLEQAQTLFKNRASWRPTWQRIEILERIENLMKEQSADLAYLIADEGGKPLIDARIEVARAIDGIGLCIKELGHLRGTEIPMDLTKAGSRRMSFTTREPIGPVVAISAFNHPLNLIVHQVAPAIATGCPVIVKPADDTPLSCKKFVELAHQAGLEEDWCKFVMCDIPTAEKMVTDSRVSFFSFIGSAKVGWMLRSKLSPGTRCALEHGGAAPVIVDETANIPAMIKSVLKGGFYHSGQVCVSVQRLFAPRNISDEIARQLAEGAAKLVVGNATEEQTECGPLIRPREVDRVETWVNEAVSSGAQLLTGGQRLGNTAYAPTVLFNPGHGAKVSTKEIFGPVVCVYSYDNVNEALQMSNALPYSFQSAVFTNQLDMAIHCIQGLDASAVMVNDHSAFRVDWMPFAGRKQSGYGIGGIGYTMHDMTQEKMAVIQF